MGDKYLSKLLADKLQLVELFLLCMRSIKVVRELDLEVAMAVSKLAEDMRPQLWRQLSNPINQTASRTGTSANEGSEQSDSANSS